MKCFKCGFNLFDVINCGNSLDISCGKCGEGQGIFDLENDFEEWFNV